MKIIKNCFKIIIIKEVQLIVSLIINFKIRIKIDFSLLKEDLRMTHQQY